MRGRERKEEKVRKKCRKRELQKKTGKTELHRKRQKE